MNKKRLELLLQHLKLVGQTDAWDLMEVISALLEEPKPVATETGVDKRTRMKKLILEMLEIV